MLDLFNIAKPQGCDIQTFYGSGTVGDNSQKSWIKPRGVSHIYMMLIGPGGGGDGSSGGGSGAVTVWYGAAQHVPDSLVVVAGSSGGAASTISARFSNSGLTPTALLTAEKANNATAATAMTANYFTASGFFKSVAGQNGSASDPGASSTTFLSGGGDNNVVTGNYGYVNNNVQGFFQMQPIIVGVGGSSSAYVYNGGIGCGGGSNAASKGGPGMVLIASW